jgi:hypothetical protein
MFNKSYKKNDVLCGNYEEKLDPIFNHHHQLIIFFKLKIGINISLFILILIVFY